MVLLIYYGAYGAGEPTVLPILPPRETSHISRPLPP